MESCGRIDLFKKVNAISYQELSFLRLCFLATLIRNDVNPEKKILLLTRLRGFNFLRQKEVIRLFKCMVCPCEVHRARTVQRSGILERKPNGPASLPRRTGGGTARGRQRARRLGLYRSRGHSCRRRRRARRRARPPRARRSTRAPGLRRDSCRNCGRPGGPGQSSSPAPPAPAGS